MVTTVRNRFKVEQKNKARKEKVIRDIRNLFELEEYYYKPEGIGNFFNNNYI